jgi:hypothetical protein
MAVEVAKGCIQRGHRALQGDRVARGPYKKAVEETLDHRGDKGLKRGQKVEERTEDCSRDKEP